MLGGLGAGSIVYPSSLEEVIERLATHGVESFPCHTTCQNSNELVEGIPHLWEHHRLTNLEPSVCVVLSPIEFLSANVFSDTVP